MTISSALARGRAAAEARMVDACTVQRKTGESEGPGGVISPTWSQVYAGKCRVQVRTEAGSPADVGEASVIITRHEIHLPISAVGILEGDQVTMTAATYDPDLVGRTYAVRDVLTKSEATARRVTAVEVSS